MGKKIIFVFLVILSITLAPVNAEETFIDDAGREFVLEERPESIVSLAPSVTEILFALEVEDRIAGVSNFCNYPEEALEKPKVGDINVDYEALIETDPDLILMMEGMEEDLERMEDLGFTVAVVNPENLDEVLESILWVGKVVSAEEAAKNQVAMMEERINEIKEMARQQEETPRVFYEVWDDPLMAAGPDTFVYDLIVTAGGQDIAEDLGQQWAPISLETLIMEDPEVIIVPWTDYERVYERENWQEISAVKNKRVVYIHEDLMSRPGPRIVAGLEQVYEALFSEE